MACCFLLVFATHGGYSQKIDNTASYRALPAESSFRFSYDNDYFTATDFYYTQGYSFELIDPVLTKNPLNKVLFKMNDTTAVSGLAFEHFGFTPTSIRSDNILIGDRPFSASMILKSFKQSVDYTRNAQLSAVLSLGLIGPAAFGKEMQKTIHRWIGGVEPRGWDNQIRNDLIINYDLNYEKLLYNNKYLSLNSAVNLRAGTLNTKAQSGAIVVFGKYASPLLGERKSAFQLYVYAQPLLNLVAYDAALQGGLFNRHSPYTIRSADVSRVVLQHNYGAVVKLRSFYLEYSRTILGKEFKTGRSHKWGGFKIALGI
jgi:hypothetical protein